MNKNNFIALLPLDNRPVSCLLPKQIADFSGINLLLPERKYLGDLKKESDLQYLEKWLRGLNNIDSLVLSLDNLVYGGLVQSRKHSFKLDELRTSIEFVKNLKNISKYGFSSIMRIPNYNSNEEEKDYWKDYGEDIFEWSKLTHRVGIGSKEEAMSHEQLIEKWYETSKRIPPVILADYKSHRDKNFTVNLLWLESLHEKCFDYLIFSCDDSAKYGMNVVESEYLKQRIKAHNFSQTAKVISGTDEIPIVLLTKSIVNNSNLKPIVSLYFDSTTGKNEIARYESDPICSTIKEHINTIGIEIKDLNESDIVLCIHCSDLIQGDHIFKIKPQDTTKNINEMKNLLEGLNKPFILIDVAYANGADPNLIKHLMDSKIKWGNCYGYAGWNTCSNSTGSALAIGINRWIAEQNNSFNKDLFMKCLLTRFLDDYAYQTQIRKNGIMEDEVNNKMKAFIKDFSQLLKLNDINVKCGLPWGRSFEVEIHVI